MITDKDTNKLFLSHKLGEKHFNVAEQFSFHCEELGIPLEFVVDTNDIWMRDFMPIQIDKDYFVGYNYNPDYLQNEEDSLTITDGNKIFEKIIISPESSPVLS